ncbi:hypothetical protein CALCODRAFT_486294 [Calocera cornea HHB12733]|uniref:Uncharacterized protein n=1 Tax=Calocera cornea HHB12733 TaxID=1353952 RepID=A0A165DTT3_9BASI|nr:hypothetical protein CALCODRAFT_486294 [Calocera cornea HHB12733]
MDFFGDLEIADEQTEKRVSREDRINRAFEESKRSYKNERVLTEPGWFNSDISVEERLQSSSRAPREVEWSIQQLYLQQQYAKCLQMSTDFLDALDKMADTSAGAPDEPKQELRRRELLDIGIRCALKLDDKQTARQLADRTRPSWRTNAGLATTAAEAYVLASQPYDAITASLDAITFRGPIHPFLSPLRRAVALLQDQHTRADPAVQDSARQAAQALHVVLDALDQRAQARVRLSLSAKQTGTRAGGELPAVPQPTEEHVHAWAEALAIPERDVVRLVRLCCSSDDASEEKDAPRSVRTL